MAAQGYFAETANVGSVGDRIITKPSGSGSLAITPTIPAAIAQTSHNTAGSTPYYTRTSSSVLVLNLLSAPTFTTGSLIGVFWSGTDGTPHYCLDCTLGISGNAVTLTAPTLSATQLADGQTYFNAATTTGASDVSGQAVVAGTTVCTFSLATLATADTPSNPDITDYSLPVASIEQLLITCTNTGGFEFFESSTVELAWNYSYAGNFYSYVKGPGVSLPWTSGTVAKLRFYNSSMSDQVMSIGVLLA
jgi:hypothetical protein